MNINKNKDQSMASTFISFAVYLLCLSITVSAFGQNAGKSFDLQGYIDEQVRLHKKVITIPAGCYRVTPHRRQHLLLSGLDGVTINAEGVEMICTETTRAITVSNCKQTIIKGLTIDYDPLPYTQGRIVKISPDGQTHDIQLFSGYAQDGKIGTRKYEIFSAEKRSLVMGSYYGCKLTKFGKGKLRMVKPAHYENQPEKVGDIIATECANAPGGSMPHAIFLDRCSKVTLEGVTLYSSNCFGFFESNCNASVYRGCVIDRRPASTDFKERENPRIRSLNADAYHSKHAQVGPSYINCSARFMGDDCVAINGDYHLVMSSAGNKLRVLAKHKMNIENGDTVEFLALNGVRPPDARVVSIKAEGEITAAEKEIRNKLRIRPVQQRGAGDSLTKAYEVTLDRAVKLDAGSMVCSANRIGNGFKVMGCELGENRSRGILVKAGNGVISGNRVDGCRMQSISLAPGYWWLEAGSGSNVVITDNVIRNSGGVSINVEALAGKGNAAQPGAHRNIAITANRIENGSSPQIYASSVDGLIVKDNIIVQDGKPISDGIKTGNSVNVKLNSKQTTPLVAP